MRKLKVRMNEIMKSAECFQELPNGSMSQKGIDLDNKINTQNDEAL